MSEDLKPKPVLKMIEIFGGRDEQWKGWHNLLLQLSDDPGDHKCIAGPIDKEISAELKIALGLN